jgi:hypothetical protein
MSDLERRPSRVPRRTREQRAYRMVVAGGVFAAVAVVGFVLAAAGVLGWGIPFIAAALAIVCGFLFRQSVR